jgi:hypothetical protein
VEKLFLVLRWLVRKHGRECYDDSQAAHRFWFKSGRSFLILTEYNPSKTPPRPTSGDPLAIRWSLWLRIGRDWYLGYGCVRTFCRNDDIDVWIHALALSSATEEIKINPPIKAVFRDGGMAVRMRNTAVNDRDAAGTIYIQSSVFRNAMGVFGPLASGRTQDVYVQDAAFRKTVSPNYPTWKAFYDESCLVVDIDSIRIVMAPTGPERIERIYGFPEWFRDHKEED